MARHQRLLGAVRDGVERVEDLARLLDVSSSTVRRGLGDLERAGKLVRTHGGAIPVGTTGEPSLRQKSRRNVGAKLRIAERAVELVEAARPGAAGDGDRPTTVLLDAGSTTALIAERLAAGTHPAGLTVVTNGIGPLQALHDDAGAGIDVIVVGGQLRRRRGSMVGEFTRAVLERVTVDIAFIGADGLVPGRGLNCSTAELAAVKELQFHAARSAVVVADSSKLGADPFPYWARPPGDYTVITDDGGPEERRRALATDPRCSAIVVPADTTRPDQPR